jgi:4-hydroxymandelate oxidase
MSEPSFSDASSLADLLIRYEDHARATLPGTAYDFIATGAGEEISQREAVDSWRRFRLRPHALRDVSDVDTSLSLLGVQLPAPMVVAPTAYHALASPGGEVETARGVRAASALMTVPTRSSTAHEQVAAALDGPWWFQVYVSRDREITRRMVNDARELGARALVLTGDTPFLGHRPRGMTPPLTAEQFLMSFQKYLGPESELMHATSIDPSIGLEAVAWLHGESGLPVLVKGVLRSDDAAACIEAGAAGIIVSNHGGRQLDRAVPAAEALAEVAAAAAGRAAVLVDGGIRSGIDAMIALALGADAVLLGRPILWALGAEQGAGVQRVLRMLREELAAAMALAGVTRLAELTSDLVTRRG